MKKVIALIVLACLVFSLCACQSGQAAEYPKVADPLTWEKINNIPIASNDMTEDQLRQICLDFMELMITFAWTPSETLNFYNQDTFIKTLNQGSIYGGIPYVTGHMGNFYTVMEYYDEKTGVLDVSSGMDAINAFANQCSGSVFWAWNRVCQSARYTNTTTTTEPYGCLRVGPYTYPENITDYLVQNMHTTTICQNNGDQIMYQSYAAAKPADGLVTCHSGNSHARMVSGTPKVVQNADGTIDGNKSTLTYMDQDGVFYQQKQSDGTAYERVGGLHVEISFAQLFREGYIPFTFAELNKDLPILENKTVLNYTDKTVTLEQLDNATLSSNYGISDVTYVIKDEKGNQVYRRLFPTYNLYGIMLRDLPMNVLKYLYPDASTEAMFAELRPFADGKHTIEISVRSGNGEKPTVYTGTLTD